MAMIIFIVLSFFLQGALGEIICEQLPVQMCTFSVASTGNRCVLESYVSNAGSSEFQCKTSDVFAENVAQWIEDDHCVEVCGVDRKTVGISSDSLAEPRIIASVCSTACYDNCPNIVDLYYNMALAEGSYLPNLCKAQNSMSRREMSQVLAWAPLSGNAESYESSAWAPAAANAESDESVAWAPAPVSAIPIIPILFPPTPAPSPVSVIPIIPILFPPTPAPSHAESDESFISAPASTIPFIPLPLAPTPVVVPPFPIAWPPAPAPASDN